MAQRGWSRRQICVAGAVLGTAASSRARATGGPLRVLAWPGYAEPEVVAAFEQRSGARVELSLVDSDTVLWQRLAHNRAQDFDVFAANTAELQRYIRQELVLPLDIKALPNRRRQLPRFRDAATLPGLVQKGRLYGVPYAYAEMGLIYDRVRLLDPPSSITALWDERYQGRVLAYNDGSHNFSLAAQALGLKNPFQLSEAQWPKAVDRLIALRRNVAGFYTQPEESVAMFKRRQAWLMFANYGSQQLQLVRQAGLDVGYVIPKEGALAWLDCWAVTRGAREPALAHAWIDHLLEPEPSRLLVTRQGLGCTVQASPAERPGDKLLWLEPVENEERRNALWARIVSGDRAARLLAP